MSSREARRSAFSAERRSASPVPTMLAKLDGWRHPLEWTGRWRRPVMPRSTQPVSRRRVAALPVVVPDGLKNGARQAAGLREFGLVEHGDEGGTSSVLLAQDGHVLAERVEGASLVGGAAGGLEMSDAGAVGILVR